MDLNKLKYFMAVAQSEHVTNAAKQLSIAQPALTRALHRFEEELGVRLFVREGRNIRLSPEGVFLRDRCAGALAELEGAESALRAFSAEEQATICVCMRSASVLVVDAIAEYSAVHPEVAFKVTQEDRPEFADVVIASEPCSDHARPAGFLERIGIAWPSQAGNARRSDSPIELKSLRDESFILLAGSRGLRPQCDRLCKARGFHPHVAFESENPSVVRKMVCLGMGIGFWPEYSWGPLDEGSTWIPLADEGFRRIVRLDITPRGMEKQHARAFKRFLSDYLSNIFSRSAR